MKNFKTKTLNQILLCQALAFLFISIQVNAQVTIGCLSVPQSGALLDLKEKEIANPDANTPNSTKGILFPKVSLKSATSLEPLFSTTAAPQTKTSKGMIVYNVNKAAGLSEGLCVWNGTEWSSILGGGPSSAAKINIKCDAKIVVSGVLSKGNTLGPYVNTITLPVEVVQKGSYHITAYPDPENEYYFEATGEFLKTGSYNLTLNGTGVPKHSTLDRSNVPDKVKIQVNGQKYDTICLSKTLPSLKVNDVPANYYFSCNHVDVSKAQLKMKEASTKAYISIRLQVPQDAVGSKYHIKTNTVNGIQFEGSGDLFAGQQTVTLQSTGATPTLPGVYDFYFLSNSSDPRIGNCSVDIPITGRDVNIYVWGEESGDWDIAAAGRGVRMILESEALFGLGNKNNPVYPVTKINLNRKNSLPSSFNDLDILIISYRGIPSGTAAERISQFIDNGGVVIHCLENGNSMDLPDSIFGKGNVTRRSETGGETYISLLSGSPLTNGVYMDIVGKDIGYDGGYNLGFDIKDSKDIEIVGKRKSDNSATIIRHKTKPYIVLGDGGIFCGATSADSNNPLQVDSKGLPVVKTGLRYPSEAYNAHLFTNIMIWAMKYRFSVSQ